MRWIAGLLTATLLAAGLTVWWTVTASRKPPATSLLPLGDAASHASPQATSARSAAQTQPAVRANSADRIASRKPVRTTATDDSRGRLSPISSDSRGRLSPISSDSRGRLSPIPADSRGPLSPATFDSHRVPADADKPQSSVTWAAERRARRLVARLEAAREALRTDPLNRQAWDDALAAVAQMGDRTARLELLAERAHYLADDPAARREYGQALLHAGRFVDAVRELRAASRLDADDATTWFALAEALRELRRLSEAAAAYRQVLERQPRHAPAMARLGEVLLDLRSWRQAEAILAQARALEPQATDLRLNHALALWQLGRFDEALDVVRSVVEDEPQNVIALSRLARWHETLFEATHDDAHRQAAVAYARRALRVVPDHADLRALLRRLTGGP